MRRFALIGFSVLAVTRGLISAEVSIGGPIAGYMTGAAGRELRVIIGVPGALGFSDPLPLPENVTRTRLAAGRDFALVERKDSDPAVLLLSGASVGGLVPLEGAMQVADWVKFSSGGSAAILYSSNANRLQVVTGLPDHARVTRDLDAENLPEFPFTGAISDDGETLLAASAQAVYLISARGAAQLVLSAGNIASLAILRSGAAVVSERSTGSVHLLQKPGSSTEARILVSGLGDIGDVFPASDDASIFVARTAEKAVSSIDVLSGEVRTFAAGVSPSSLHPLRNRDTFLISARPRQPGYVFFRDGDSSRVVFVPAVTRGRESLR